MGLELYAKIEPYLDFKEELNYLYGCFVEKIDIQKPKSILDVGCGNGSFLYLLKELGYKNTMGIDLSHNMISIANSKGINARVIDIKNLNKK